MLAALLRHRLQDLEGLAGEGVEDREHPGPVGHDHREEGPPVAEGERVAPGGLHCDHHEDVPATVEAEVHPDREEEPVLRRWRSVTAGSFGTPVPVKRNPRTGSLSVDC